MEGSEAVTEVIGVSVPGGTLAVEHDHAASIMSPAGARATANLLVEVL